MRHCSARALLLSVALLLAAACAIPGAKEPLPGERSIWLVSHGWHVGIAVARTDVDLSLWPERDDLGPFAFLEVGWGDDQFYPADRGSLGQALAAAFGSRGSVLHVSAFDPPPARYFAAAEVVEVGVSHAGLQDLCRFVAGYYAKDDGGRALAVGPGLYGASRFYRARGRYGLTDNSNRWTASALRSAGVAIDPETTVTAGQVLAAARALR